MKLLYGLILIMHFSCIDNSTDDKFMRQIDSEDKIVAFIYEENSKQGLIDTNNNILLKAQFDYIENNQQYNLIVIDSGGQLINGGDYIGYKYNKYGLINTKGEILFRPQFDKLIISDNSALVMKDSLYGYISNEGKWIIEPKYKIAYPFNNGAAIVKKGDKFFIINKTDNLVSNISFDTLWGFKNGISVVKKSNKWGLINTKGEFVLPLDNYTGIGEFHWYYGVFQENKKWHIVDTSGKIFQQAFDEVDIKNRNDTIYAEGVNNNREIIIRLK